jgi:hypothetical protein
MIIKGKVDITRIPTGHKQHMSGSGVHNDRRNRRNNTRSSQVRKALKDFS